MKRFLRVLKFVAIGIAALVAVGLFINVVLNVRARSRLERKVEGLRAEGQPVTVADLKPEATAPAENAATYLRRAQSDVDAIQKEVSAAIEASPQEEQDRFYEGQPSPAILKAIASALAAYPKVPELLMQASNCPTYDPQLDFSTDMVMLQEAQIDNMSEYRGALRVLNYLALWQLSDDKPQQALETCLAMFRLARLYDGQPFVNGHLVALACRGISIDAANRVVRSELTAEAREALDAELARHDLTEAFRHAIATERAFGLESFREMGVNLSLGPIGPLFLKNDAAGYLDLMAEVIAEADQPYQDRDVSKNAVLASAGPLVQLVVPALQAAVDADYRLEAELRALRVLNALQRHSGDANQPVPPLAELDLPKTATLDPFTGQPLHVSRQDDGWLIYSVGTNLKDDGGDFTNELDTGLAPPTGAIATEDTE